MKLSSNICQNSPNCYSHLIKDTHPTKHKVEKSHNEQAVQVDFSKGPLDKSKNIYGEQTNCSREIQFHENISVEKRFEEKFRHIPCEPFKKCNISSTVKTTFNKHAKDINHGEKKKKVQTGLKAYVFEKKEKSKHVKIVNSIQTLLNFGISCKKPKYWQYYRSKRKRRVCCKFCENQTV